MGKTYSHLGSSLNLEQARYDLSMVYAKAKLEEKLRDENVYGQNNFPSETEMEYLEDSFCQAWGYYANLTGEYIEAFLEDDSEDDLEDDSDDE